MTGIDFLQDLGVVLLVAALVGWIFQKMGLSPVVGYLIAGIIIGPYTPPFPLVQDIERIQTLANLGLVFLMFWIGMGLSVNRLRKLGMPLVVATAVMAFLVFNGWRVTGNLLGLSALSSLFLAGMFISSSSAIIGKVLQENHLTHHRSGQVALGITVLEDMVAILVLTTLLAVVGSGGEESISIPGMLGGFGAFVIFVSVVGLLLLPRVLRRLSLGGGEELQTVAVGALLLLLAVLAVQTGYSLALGAFLLGAVVAEIPQSKEIERAFTGLRHVFSAVFFVAIGMLIEVRLLAEVWPMILIVSALCIVGRASAALFACLLVGHPFRDSVRTGLALTPMGEFAFIVAQAGILSAVLPANFYPLAVGVSLLTAIIGPWLVSRSESLSNTLDQWQPGWFRRLVFYYQTWLERMTVASKATPLWQLSRKRFIQIGVGLLFVGGLLILATPVYERTASWLGEDFLFPRGTTLLFWAMVAIGCLFPVYAVWRNVSALALLYAQSLSTSGGRRSAPVAALTENGIKAVTACFIFLWIWVFLPKGTVTLWVVAGLVVLAGVQLLLFRRRMVYVQSHFESELHEVLGTTPGLGIQKLPSWLKDHRELQFYLGEISLSADASSAGQSLASIGLRTHTGCSVVRIDRQGHPIDHPGPDTILYPGDKLLLLGSRDQVDQAQAWLHSRESLPAPGLALDSVSMETVNLPEDSPKAGQTLANLDLQRTIGIQVAGILRQGQLIPTPGAHEILQTSDALLVIGSGRDIRRFREWLASV